MQGEAATIAALLAVDPAGLGGVALRAPACAERDAWLALLRDLLPRDTPLRRVPLNISDTALLGWLDLGATLQAGRPVALQGLLAQADGGVLLLAMAERMTAAAAARFGSVLDTRSVRLQRDGLDSVYTSRLAMVALDEGASDDEHMPASLADRLAFRLLMGERADDEEGPQWTAQEVLAARARLAQVHLPPDEATALCAAALALGIDSLRASVFAARAARAAAALAGCDSVEEEHTAVAARLVLAPRATRLPPAPPPPDSAEAQEPPPEPPESQEDQTEPPASPPPGSEPDPAQDGEDGDSDEAPEGEPQAGQTLGERVLEAAQAAIPAGLLARLKISQLQRTKTPSSGSAGAMQKNALRGRPVGARKGEPRAGQRLNVLETLRAAAPWQRLRQAAMPATAAQRPRIVVRKEDFHVARFRQLGQTTTVFVVDASGSLAINRLAETKGAVELLLADCYVRRDSVAVLAFRGKTAEVLLPPTRSLARAKRSLAGLPGGGGTPLANAIDAAGAMADQIRRKGETPILVLLTDAKANIARDGSPGRSRAASDALAAAHQLRLGGYSALLVDASPQPQPGAQQLAAAMGAQYLALPYAGAQSLNQAVRTVAGRS
ncbi:MAG: magnesium chelatase subunit D [Burkholderiales bacterium]|nr:magnesium chelatase subunit D [Burkholderiales bacterium]